MTVSGRQQTPPGSHPTTDTGKEKCQKPSTVVIGLGIRLPGASDLKEVPHLLQEQDGADWTVPQSALLDRIYFGYSQEEASQCSPLLGASLEVTAECILDSGITFSEISERRTGLYLQSNVLGSYTSITTELTRVFKLNGPVLDFSARDVSPVTALQVAFGDLVTGKCDLAIVVGIHKKALPADCGYDFPGDFWRQETSTAEGFVAILLSLSSSPLSRSLPRIYCQVQFDFLNTVWQSMASDSPCAVCCPLPNQRNVVDIFQIDDSQHRADGPSRKTPEAWADVIRKYFSSSLPISALVGIVVSIWKLVTRQATQSGNQAQITDPGFGQRSFVVVCTDPGGKEHEIIVSRVMTTKKTSDNLALVVPVIIHPLVDEEETESDFLQYERVPGFLEYFIGSELSAASNDTPFLRHYFLRMENCSHFFKLDFSSLKEVPVSVVFDDFLLSSWSPSSDILDIPTVRRSILLIDQILQDSSSSLSLEAILKSGDIPDPVTDGGFLVRVACQIAMVDLMACVGALRDVDVITSVGVGIVAASYADEALTLKQAVQVALVMQRYLCEARTSLKDMLLVDVHCSTDLVYQLGPWVRVLCHFTSGMYRIAVPIDKRDTLIKSLLMKGVAHRKLCAPIPVYCQDIAPCLEGMKANLDAILPCSLFWSSRFEIVSALPDHGCLYRLRSKIFVDILTMPFDGNLEKESFGMPDQQNNSLCWDPECNTLSTEGLESAGKILDMHCNGKTNQDQHWAIGNLKTPKKSDMSALTLDCSTRATRGSILLQPTNGESLCLGADDSAGSFRSSPLTNPSEVCEECTESCDENSVRLLSLHIFTGNHQAVFDGRNLDDSDSSTFSRSFSNSMRADKIRNLNFRANRCGFLESLAALNSSGKTVKAERQLTDGEGHPLNSDPYCGDFVVSSLWTWHRQPSSQKDSSMSVIEGPAASPGIQSYPISTKPLLQESVIQAMAGCARKHLQDDPIESPDQTLTEWKNSLTRKSDVPSSLQTSLMLLSGYTLQTTSFNNAWQMQGTLCEPLCELLDALKSANDNSQRSQFNENSQDVEGGDSSCHTHSCLCAVPALGFDGPKDKQMLYTFSNAEELLNVLISLQGNEFRFVSMLQLEESLETHLLDMLDTFPDTSSLHAFFTHTLLTTCSSKFSLTVSKTENKSAGTEMSIVLRNRCEGTRETCLSIGQVCSVLAGQRDRCNSHYTVRVFELSKLPDFDESSLCQIELAIFKQEQHLANYFAACQDSDSSSSSSCSDIMRAIEMTDDLDAIEMEDDLDANGNIFHTDKKTTTSEHGQESSKSCQTSKTSSSCRSSPFSMIDVTSTSFCLHIDEFFVKTLTRLVGINAHTVAYILPKDWDGQGEQLKDDQGEKLQSGLTNGGCTCSMARCEEKESFVPDCMDAVRDEVCAKNLTGNVPDSERVNVQSCHNSKFSNNKMNQNPLAKRNQNDISEALLDKNDILATQSNNCNSLITKTNGSQDCNSKTEESNDLNSKHDTSLDLKTSKSSQQVLKTNESNKHVPENHKRSKHGFDIENNKHGCEIIEIKVHGSETNGSNENDSKMNVSNEIDSRTIENNSYFSYGAEQKSSNMESVTPGGTITKSCSLHHRPVYMLSLKENSGLQIFLYGRHLRDMSHWDSIERVTHELKMRHPDLSDTHLVHVSRFKDDFLFEELLYTFFNGSNFPPTRVSPPCSEIGLTEISSMEFFLNPHDSARVPNTPMGLDLNGLCELSTVRPEMFLIPQIVITPPEGVSQKSHTRDITLPEGISQKTHARNTTPLGGIVQKSHVRDITSTMCNVSAFTSVASRSSAKGDKHQGVELAELSQESVPILTASSVPMDKNGNCTETRNEVGNLAKSPVTDNLEHGLSLLRDVYENKGVCNEVTALHECNQNSFSKDACSKTDKSNKSGTVKDNDSDTENDSNKENSSKKENSCNKDINSDTEHDSNKENNSKRENSCKKDISSDTDIENDSSTENNSNKENEISASPLNLSLSLTRRPCPDYKEMQKFKVTAMLSVHLTDRTSVLEQQEGRAAGNLLLYWATNEDNQELVLGVVLFGETDVFHTRIKVSTKFCDANLESALNFLFAWYILRVQARLKSSATRRPSIAIQPPLQRDSAAILVSASVLGGGTVVTASHREEVVEELESLLPQTRVLKDDLNCWTIYPLVGRHGVDVSIMLRQQEFGAYMDMLGPAGRLVLCGDVDCSQKLELSALSPNRSVMTFDPLTAAQHVCCMSQEECDAFCQDLDSLLTFDPWLNEHFETGRDGYFYEILGNVTPATVKEEPVEQTVYNLFLSSDLSVCDVFKSSSLDQRPALDKIYGLMSISYGGGGGDLSGVDVGGS